MITEDYILRMIRDMVRMIAHLTGVPTDPLTAPQFRESLPAGKLPPLLEQLVELADRGEINEAENRLFEELDFADPEQLSVALLFYRHINGFSEEKLLTADYSREEIAEGLKDCAERFGLDSALLDEFAL